MACATLKRSLDWEQINQRPTKRRRCSPFGGPSTPNGSTSNNNVKIQEPTSSPFAEVTLAKLTPGKFLLIFLFYGHFMQFIIFFFLIRKNGTKYP